jgi:hypothetical protein
MELGFAVCDALTFHPMMFEFSVSRQVFACLD